MSEDENLSVPSSVNNSGIKRTYKIVKRLIIVIALLFLTVVSGAVILGYYYHDEVKSYMIGELNKNLNTQIIIDGNDIDFTVLRNFPFASLEFKNVKALEAIESSRKDTLFRAKNISLQFNIIDLFNKNYRIKKMVFDDVELDVRIDKNGRDNYHFWKTSSQSDTGNFSFALEEILLKQVQFTYFDLQHLQRINLLLHKGSLAGQFSKKKYSLEVLGDMFIREARLNDDYPLKNKNIKVETTLSVDNEQKNYRIDKGAFAVEQLNFLASGTIAMQNATYLDLKIKGDKMDIRSVLSLIPMKYKEKISNYESEGEFYFLAHIKGAVSGGQSPLVTTQFGIKQADITQLSNNISLKKVTLEGDFSNGSDRNARTSKLNITSFNAALGKGLISGSLIINDFEDMLIQSKIKADISLEGLQEFIKWDTVESVSGNLNLDVDVSGKWDDIYTVAKEKSTTSGSLSLANMDLKIKNNILQFSNINGHFSFDDNNLIINQFSGNVSQSDFNLNGIFKNVMGYFFKENETITIDAALTSKNIDLNELLQDKEEEGASKEEYKVRFSDNINLNLNSTIDHLVFRKFEANTIKGVVKMYDKKMLIEPIVFSTMDGIIGASGVIDGRDTTTFYVHCLADLRDINITKMFVAFENFGQTTITNENIKGIANANIQFKAPVSPNLTVHTDRLVAKADMVIEKGELNNVESMKSLSKYIELQELMNVKFATLKNTIEVKNQIIFFPKMEISSNAINLTASGTHLFSNEINYKIKLTLDELLSKKARRNKKENDAFGETIDDGTGRTNIFLTMTGTVDNPIIKYDTKEAIQNLKENIKEEKQTVKSLLKDEFGWFKNDSTIHPKNKEEEPGTFKIKWEEASPPKEEKKKTLKPPKKKVDDEDF